jgi:hypothetical protein
VLGKVLNVARSVSDAATRLERGAAIARPVGHDEADIESPADVLDAPDFET